MITLVYGLIDEYSCVVQAAEPLQCSERMVKALHIVCGHSSHRGQKGPQSVIMVTVLLIDFGDIGTALNSQGNKLVILMIVVHPSSNDPASLSSHQHGAKRECDGFCLDRFRAGDYCNHCVVVVMSTYCSGDVTGLKKEHFRKYIN